MQELNLNFEKVLTGNLTTLKNDNCFPSLNDSHFAKSVTAMTKRIDPFSENIYIDLLIILIEYLIYKILTSNMFFSLHIQFSPNVNCKHKLQNVTLYISDLILYQVTSRFFL